jgi:hypothetical protein
MSSGSLEFGIGDKKISVDTKTVFAAVFLLLLYVAATGKPAVEAPTPPRWWELLASRLLDEDSAEEILGDLAERFARDVAAHGVARARSGCRRAVMSLFVAYIRGLVVGLTIGSRA